MADLQFSKPGMARGVARTRRQTGWRPILAALAATIGLAALAPGAARAHCSDLALVLAIDASGSIDDAEFALQRLGYARALTDPSVLQAIGSVGSVEIAALIWGDSAMPRQVIPWHRIDRAEDAARLATAILTAPRLTTGDTDIGNGLEGALELLGLPRRCTARAIVNLSGDGRATRASHRNRSLPVEAARAQAASLGVTINALAILNEEPALARYYRDAVITGPSAFVMTVADFGSFGDAIRLKLLREITLPATAGLPERVALNAGPNG
jgi:Ca-activated chloride channel homolog